MKILKYYKQYQNDTHNRMLESNTQNTHKEWFEAIVNNNINIVKSLINSGLDVNIIDSNKWSGLMCSVYEDFRDIAELLISHPDIDINYSKISDGRNALSIAVIFLKNELIEMLLNHPDIDVNARFIGGYTVLTDAAEEGSCDIIKILLSHPKIDVNISENFIYILKSIDISLDFLKDYDLQKKIIDNGREDIIAFLYKHGIYNENIKQQYPHIFTGSEFNLLD